MDASEKHRKIDSAIKTHYGWLESLKAAIVTGGSEFTPETVDADNACELYRWLSANMRELCRDEKVCEEIRAVHAAFHRKAGAVLAMALRGERDAACSEVVPGSELAALSGRLVALLRAL